MRSTIIQLASLLLEPGEREMVLGDLIESRETLGKSLLNVVDLAARRYLSEWQHWQPWLGLLGVAILVGHFLSNVTFQLDQGVGVQIRTYLRYGVHYEMGVSATKDIATLACELFALALWSWTSGIVLASLARRSAWIIGLLLYVVVTTATPITTTIELRGTPGAVYGYLLPLKFVFLRLLLPISLARICFVVAAASGLIQGRRQMALGAFHRVALAAVAAVSIFLMLWTGGWYEAAKISLSNGTWQAIPWTQRIWPFLLMSWPAAYLVANKSGLTKKLGCAA